MGNCNRLTLCKTMQGQLVMSGRGFQSWEQVRAGGLANGATMETEDMNTRNVKEIFAINAEATRIERERCLQAVKDEPELPGDMPDEMWATIAGDRDAITEALRVAVRQTKARIRERIIGG